MTDPCFIVDRPDDPVSLTLDPQIAYVLKSVSMTCDITDVGNPSAEQYYWFKNDDLIQNTSTGYTSFVPYHINNAGDYSCFATNFPMNFPPMSSAISPSTWLSVNGECKG